MIIRLGVAPWDLSIWRKKRFAEGAGPDKRTYRVDCSRIENELPGWDPQWDAYSGAGELYEAYQEHGLDEAAFQGPLYVRLKHLQGLIEGGRMTNDLRWRG